MAIQAVDPSLLKIPLHCFVKRNSHRIKYHGTSLQVNAKHYSTHLQPREGGHGLLLAALVEALGRLDDHRVHRQHGHGDGGLGAHAGGEDWRVFFWWVGGWVGGWVVGEQTFCGTHGGARCT